ncbi:MAG: hypothetical protein AB8H79_05735 [Myxococcota bacterium]
MPTPLAAFEAAVPTDERVQHKTMFGSPCAFVNRQMFFGTFENTVVARVGPERVIELSSQDGMGVFTLAPDKQWPDYIQVDPNTPPDVLAGLAAESLAWAAALPLKMKPPKKTKRAKRNAQKHKAAQES